MLPALRKDVGEHLPPGKPPGKPERAGHSGVEMRPGNIANRVDHGQNHKPKREGNSHVGNTTARDIIDDNCPGARKNERKGTQTFRSQFSHSFNSIVAARHITARSVFKIWLSCFASAAASGVLANDLWTQPSASRTATGAVLPGRPVIHPALRLCGKESSPP